jgi:hypothetical protein
MFAKMFNKGADPKPPAAHKAEVAKVEGVEGVPPLYAAALEVANVEAEANKSAAAAAAAAAAEAEAKAKAEAEASKVPISAPITKEQRAAAAAEAEASEAPISAPITKEQRAAAAAWAQGLLDDKDARIAYATKVFVEADVDGSASLEPAEALALVRKIARNVHLDMPSDENVQKLLKICDKSRDGALQINEFQAFFKSMLESALKRCRERMLEPAGATAAGARDGASATGPAASDAAAAAEERPVSSFIVPAEAGGNLTNSASPMKEVTKPTSPTKEVTKPASPKEGAPAPAPAAGTNAAKKGTKKGKK